MFQEGQGRNSLQFCRSRCWRWKGILVVVCSITWIQAHCVAGLYSSSNYLEFSFFPSFADFQCQMWKPMTSPLCYYICRYFHESMQLYLGEGGKFKQMGGKSYFSSLSLGSLIRQTRLPIRHCLSKTQILPSCINAWHRDLLERLMLKR